MASDYRFSSPLIARLLGLFLAGIGLAILVLTAVVAVFDLPLVVLTVAVILAVGAVVVVGLLVIGNPAVVRLDEDGYRIRLIRGAGVKRARWAEVRDVVATTVADERCIVLRLMDGRTTVLPVRALAGSPDGFVRDLQKHLDTGHGYRRIG